jgi:hypothetical protein
MKNKFLKMTLSIAIIMLVFIAFSPVALAELNFNVSVYPTQLMGPGDVSYTVEVAGQGSGDVYIPGRTESFSTAGETVKFTGTITVSEFPKVLEFKLAPEDGESITRTITVSKKAPVRSLDKSYIVDRLEGPEGTQIGIVFFIENTGGKTLSNVKVRDEALNGGAWLGGITVEPGERRMITCKHTIVRNESLTPTLRYDAGGQTYDESFGEKKLKVTKGEVIVKISADKTEVAAGEEVVITINILNDSNIYLRNLKLYDHNNVEVKLKGDILRGSESVTATSVAIFRESGTIQFDITAMDSYKTVYSYASNKLDISVPIEFNPNDLKISAESEYSSLAEPGLAAFKVLLTNDSFYGLNDLNIIDMATGDILKTLSHLDKGERLVRVKTQVDVSRQVSFKVEALDAGGNMQVADTSETPISIKVLSEDNAPETTPTPTPTPTPSAELTDEPSDVLSRLVLILIIIGIFILGVIIAISAIISKSKKSLNSGGKAKSEKKSKAKKQKSKSQARTSNPVPKKRPRAPKRKKPNNNISVKYRNTNRLK